MGTVNYDSTTSKTAVVEEPVTETVADVVTYEELSNSVLAEVQRAKEMWPGDFDDKNTLNDWATFINIYFGRAAAMGTSKEDVVKNIRKAAGLALNALYYAENGLLAPRHYDGQPRPVSPPDIEEAG